MKLTKITLITLIFFTLTTLIFAENVIYSFDQDFPPFTFMEKGKAVGFEIDLAKAILAETDYKLDLSPGQWADVQEKLKTGKIQITSGMAQTKERKKLYDFVQIPNSRLQIRIFVKSNSKIKCFADLNNKFVGTQKGSWYADVVEQHGHDKIKLYDTEAAALLALSREEVSAFVGAAKTAYYNMRKVGLDNIVSVGTPLELKQIYFAIEKDKKQLLAVSNNNFQKIIDNGLYEEIFKKWFVKPVSTEYIEKLINSAKEVSRFSYAPYSNYAVGAAILTRNGNIYTGCNVENALLNLTTSAVKVALLKAISQGESEFVAIVNLLPDGKLVPPAADERQLIYEFGSGTQIILNDTNDKYKSYLISGLLPFAFDLYK